MKKFKQVISFALLLSIILSSSIFAYADQFNEYNTIETETENIVTVYSKDYIVQATYNKIDNTMHLVTTQDNEVIEELLIDLNVDKENDTELNSPAPSFSQDEETSLFALDEDTGKRMMSSQYTILNYEYEEWWYPNFNNGIGTFWNLRTFSNSFKLCYEDEGSPYTRSIDRFVDSVEVINKSEVIAGATAAIAIGAAIASGGISVALQAKIEGILIALGVVGAVSVAYDLYNAIKTCQTSWDAIY